MEDLYSVKQAAKHLGCSEALLRRRLFQGRLSHVKVGPLTAVSECLKALVVLDPRYQGLLERAHARLFKTRVAQDDKGYVVVSTYNEDINSQFKSLGMRWDPLQRGWRAESTGQLDGALKALADAVPEVLGPNGEVIVLIKRGYQV
jgi:hypothetical protein